jgi:hypothetical protein
MYHFFLQLFNLFPSKYIGILYIARRNDTVRKRPILIGLFLMLVLSLAACTTTGGVVIEQSGPPTVHHMHTSHRGAHIRPGTDTAINAAAAKVPDCCN